MKPTYPIERWEAEGGAPEGDRPFDWRARLDFGYMIDGSPWIKGTWVSARDIVIAVAAGATWDRIAEGYSQEITINDIRACLMWAEEGGPRC
jgi:hypothetical protein